VLAASAAKKPTPGASVAVAAAAGKSAAASAAAPPAIQQQASPVQTRAKRRRLASILATPESDAVIPQLDGASSPAASAASPPLSPPLPSPSSPSTRPHLRALTYVPAGPPLRSPPPQCERREEIEGRGTVHNGQTCSWSPEILLCERCPSKWAQLRTIGTVCPKCFWTDHIKKEKERQRYNEFYHGSSYDFYQ
jgi:hypothetical protein